MGRKLWWWRRRRKGKDADEIAEQEKWSAVYNIQSILLSLQSLLGEPNTYVLPHRHHVPRCFDPLPPLTIPPASHRSTARPRSCGTRTRLNTRGF